MLIQIKKTQSTAEYAILFAIVIGAAMGVQHYVKRALQARIYDAANDFINQTGGQTLQWDPISGAKTTTNQISERGFSENYEKKDTPFVYVEKTSANYTMIKKY
jgi:hypothetical protein